jgi:hypothetical protein
MMSDNWLVRPVAADCGRIDLDDLDQNRRVDERHSDELKLLRAMEAANIHFGRTSAQELKTAFKRPLPGSGRHLRNFDSHKY